MRNRSIIGIADDLARKLRIWKGSKGTRLIEKAMREAQANGIRMAAAVATDYDKYNSHPTLVSDCILAKLNVIKGKPRKNKDAAAIDALISSIEQKVSSVEGMTRFMFGLAKYQKKKAGTSRNRS